MTRAIVTKLPLFAGIVATVTGGACANPSIQSVGGAGGSGPDAFAFTVADAAAGERAPVGGPVTGDGCAFQSFAAERLPLDLLVLVDASGSMGDPVAGSPRTKWALAGDALTAFAKDPGAAGTGIGLQFFPLLGPGSPCATSLDCGYPAADVCTNGRCTMAAPVCEADRYAKPAVDIADLPAGAAAFVATLGARQPDGLTPMAEAVIGSLNYLRARATAMPRRRAALVIATDGLPSGCSDRDIPVVGDSIWTAHNTPPIVPTYVIGLLDAADAAGGEAALGELANAGGSGTPFIVTPAGDLTQRLLAALDQIRGDALPCEYAIPAAQAGDIDFDKVNVHFQTAGGEGDVPYVGAAAHCDATKGGWYYDVDPQAGTPTHVIVCPTSCARFKADPAAKVTLRFGCKTIVIR
jgi:hypothetical protein